MEESLHLKWVKWVGVVLLLSSTTFSLVTIVNIVWTPSDSSLPNLNRTLCSYIKQFPLGNNHYATVCHWEGKAFVDIRRFHNGTATIRGIPLHLVQWWNLVNQVKRIELAIKEGSL